MTDFQYDKIAFVKYGTMKIISLIILILILSSCNDDTFNNEQSIKNTNYSSSKSDLKDYELKREKIHGQVISLIIGNYNVYTFNHLDLSKNIVKVSNRETVDKYYNLFTTNSNVGYCCCPSRDLVITFVDSSYSRKTFFVDTVMYDNEVLIFPLNYNRCTTLNKKEWYDLVNQGISVSKKDYFIKDLTIAREVLKIINESNLILLKNSIQDNPWEIHDGKFYIQVAKIGQTNRNEFSEEVILSTIKQVYPDDYYTFGLSKRFQMCESYDGHDCIEEYTIEINCNYDFYEKFNIYTPKSYFVDFSASFVAVGDSSLLRKIDILIEENDKSVNK